MKIEPVTIDFDEALETPEFYGNYLNDDGSWFNWKVFGKAAFGLGSKMSAKEFEAFCKFTQRKKRPMTPFELVLCLSGRKSGKTKWVGITGTYTCLFCSHLWRDVVSPGQKVYFPIIAVDMMQARECFNYISGILNSNPIFKRMILNERAWDIELNTGAVIMIRQASFKHIRSPLFCGAILDELAFFKDDTSASPADELIKAIMPGMLPGTILWGITSVYSRFGTAYQLCQDFHGTEDEDVLVWKSDTMSMNPTFSRGKIDKALKVDRIHAEAEYLSIFRSDRSQFLLEEKIQNAVIPNRHLLPKVKDQNYVAAVDSSSGRNDSFALAIAHREGERVILDRLEERVPPFRPGDVIKEYTKIMREEYGIRKVVSDKYAIGFVQEGFEKAGVTFKSSPKTASENYLEFAAILNQEKAELLDNARLVTQLRRLERKPRSSGKDMVDHPPFEGEHDDLAAATAMAMVEADSKRKHGGALLWSDRPAYGIGSHEDPDYLLNEQERSKVIRRQIKEGIISTNWIDPKKGNYQ